MESWLAERGFTSKRLRWLVEYGCRDDFGGSLGQTSAWAGLHYHAARLPGEDPDEEAAEFLTWPEGNGRLVDHLAKSAAGRIVTGALVFDLVPRTAPGGPVSLRYLDAAKDEVVAVEARDAVAAIPEVRPRPGPRPVARGAAGISLRPRLRPVARRECDALRPAEGARLSDGVGQRPLRLAVARLRRGDPPDGARLGARRRADRLDLVPRVRRRGGEGRPREALRARRGRSWRRPSSPTSAAPTPTSPRSSPGST